MNAQMIARRAEVVAVTKDDPDPSVRHRAHVLLVMLDAPTQLRAAQQCGVSLRSVLRWQERFLDAGRDGLADRPRPGRPSKLGMAAYQLLEDALGQAPRAYGYPVTVWTITDLRDLLQRHGWPVAHNTVVRAVRALGFVYRRPRHDLRHRQDAEAVASATDVLRMLQKRGVISPAECDCFISMSADCTPIPTWSRSGSDAANQPACRPLEPIADSPSSAPSTIDPVS